MRGVYGGWALHPPCRLGIIPACAGFTTPSPRAGSLMRDHPRMRGVYSVGRGYRRSGAGSSPHARGLPRSQSSCLILSGIIPACAGFTTPREDVTGIMRDHPRMRGVYGITRRGERPAEGSSPHARGLRPARIVTADTYRIIPACAGFTDRLPARQVQDTDHPRMRGVYAEAFALPVIEGGSSPHARGLLVTPAEQESRGGIIPACAGFTRRPSPSR